jgi:hypothetical protein
MVARIKKIESKVGCTELTVNLKGKRGKKQEPEINLYYN